jgi:hypothetical protein
MADPAIESNSVENGSGSVFVQPTALLQELPLQWLLSEHKNHRCIVRRLPWRRASWRTQVASQGANARLYELPVPLRWCGYTDPCCGGLRLLRAILLSMLLLQAG